MADINTIRKTLMGANLGAGAGAGASTDEAGPKGALGGLRPRSYMQKGLTGARKQQHLELRKAGYRWCSVGLGQLVGTGAAVIWLGGAEGTELTVSSEIVDARLCMVNDGGTATYFQGLTVGGQTIYTGTKLSVAVCLVGKATNVPDACDKDAGYPIGDITKGMNVGVYITDVGDTVELFVNGYVKGNLTQLADNDDDAPA